MGIILVVICVLIGLKLVIPLLYLLACWLLGLTDKTADDKEN